jgi:hypothetical protein
MSEVLRTPSIYVVLVDWHCTDRALTVVGVFASALGAETPADQMACRSTVVFLDWNFLTYIDRYDAFEAWQWQGMVKGHLRINGGQLTQIRLRAIGLGQSHRGSWKSTRIEGFVD